MSKVNMILSVISAQKKLAFRAAQIGVRNISISNVLRKNHYEVLGIPRDATQADIKNAYFELSKIYHPDRIAATDENIARFREVSAAYEILGNEQSRKLYDRGLIGDFKRAGEEEITDPIIKFYQRRHEVTKAQAKGADELEAWTQTYFKQVRAKASKKHEFYVRSKKHKDDKLDTPYRYALQVSLAVFLSVLFGLCFKDTKAEKALRKVLHQ